MTDIHAFIRAKFTNVVRGRDDMHAYQADKAVPFLRENPFSALFIDMGMGKTVSTATVIGDLLAEFAYDKVLVIGPLRVATETWPTEFGLWQHTAWMNFSVIHVDDSDPRLAVARRAAASAARAQGLSSAEAAKVGQRAETAEKNRLRALAAHSSASVHIVSRDWVEWLVNLHGVKWPYRMVVIDESSGFKDYKSGRFKALAKVRNTEGLIERMHLLTATPAAETYEHLFAQIFLLDRGERFGKHITKFRERYFNYNRWSMKWKLREGCEDEILQKIADICLVMKAEDYLDLEKPTILRRPVHLSESEMALYKAMETNFVVTLADGTEIEAETAAALSSKLLQLASGVLYETVETEGPGDEIKRSTKVHAIHAHKIAELQQIVEELQGSTVLVAYHFKSSLERLRKAFPKATVMDRDGKCVKPWNAGKIPMLLMHPQSGGHGLNLQAGGHHVVFFDLPWSLELYLQLIGRLARQGQKEPVFVHLLTAVGTMDETVHQALSMKEDAQELLFSKLKRLIRAARKRQSRTVPVNKMLLNSQPDVEEDVVL